MKKGKIQTVLGPIEPDSLKTTLMHEHLICSLLSALIKPETSADKRNANSPITLQNLGWVRQNWLKSKSNLVLDDEKLAINELLKFKQLKGNSIVDVSSNGLYGDPTAVARISRATGVNVVFGTGYYVDAALSAEFEKKSQETITQEIIDNITIGFAETGIKAGIIGEIGTTWPLTSLEEKSLEAAIDAHNITGAALSIHLGKHPKSPFYILEILQKKNANINKVIFCHMDRTIEERNSLKAVAESGVNLEYDTFGMEVSYLPYSYYYLPSDAEKIKRIMWLIEDGFIDQIVVSQDIACKIRLQEYGGTGYGHILEYIIPWMKELGVSEKELNKILEENPRKILTF